jgi:hypothetical protein
MMIIRKSVIDNELPSENKAATSERFLLSQEIQSFVQGKNSEIFSQVEGLSTDQLLLRSSRAICEKYRIRFAHLSTIQRKFVTHFRCSQCGLLPLYHLNLLHIKRVRCRKCGQLIAFKKKGKYGKLRKEIAFELMKEIHGGVMLAQQ